MSAETKCIGCHQPRTVGMFCASCSRVATVLESIRAHWEQEEVDGLLRFLGDELPAEVHKRISGMDSSRRPLLIHRVVADAMHIGLLPVEWRKVKDLAERWAKSKLVTGDAEIPDKQEVACPRRTHQ